MTEADAETVIAQLHSMGVNLAAARYTVIDAAFDPLEEGREALRSLAETSGGILHVTNCRSGARILVLGDTETDTEERAYAFGASSANELERCGCSNIRISIGEIVKKPVEILHSMDTARHIRHSLDNSSTKTLIVGVRELNVMPSEKQRRSVSA